MMTARSGTKSPPSGVTLPPRARKRPPKVCTKAAPAPGSPSASTARAWRPGALARRPISASTPWSPRAMIGAPNTHGPSMTIISPCATTSRGSSATPPRAARPATRYCMGGAVLRNIGPTSHPIEASSEGSALTRELLVLDPVRDGGIRAEPAHLVGFVVLEVALEPLDMALPLEGQHVGRDAVEEPAVMADDDGAAGEILQRLLERPQGVDVEIVGRLVEQQQVRAR